MTTTEKDTERGIRLIESVVTHARNQATENAAANHWEAIGEPDRAEVRRQSRNREEELVTARGNELADILRALGGRVAELESELADAVVEDRKYYE